MLLGQSVFQSVLTRLKEERAEDEDETSPGFRISGLGMGFVASTDDTPVATAADVDAYFAFLPDEPAVAPDPLPPVLEEPPAPPVIPVHLLRVSADEIAEDLGILKSDTEAMLAEKRRQFAKANHPDGVAPEYRENATIRMQTANLLIDTAIKGLFWR